MALFENYERRIAQIEKTLNEHGIASIEEAKAICDEHGIDVYNLVKSIQPICFENACWAYVVGAAIALEIIIPTTFTFAAASNLGKISRSALPLVIASSIIITFSPSTSCLPTKKAALSILI